MLLPQDRMDCFQKVFSALWRTGEKEKAALSSCHSADTSSTGGEGGGQAMEGGLLSVAQIEASVCRRMEPPLYQTLTYSTAETSSLAFPLTLSVGGRSHRE